jgi:hypothetical protein
VQLRAPPLWDKWLQPTFHPQEGKMGDPIHAYANWVQPILHPLNVSTQRSFSESTLSKVTGLSEQAVALDLTHHVKSVCPRAAYVHQAICRIVG